MGIGAAPCKPKHAPLGVLVPVGRPQAGESGDKIYPFGMGDRTGKFFDVPGVFDDLQAVAQPLYHCPGNEDTAFQDVLGFSIQLPCHRGKQVVFGDNGLIPDVHEHKTAGSIGVFDHSGLGAHLSEQGRLLIAHNTCDWDFLGKEIRTGVTVDLTGGFYPGQHAPGYGKEFQQFLVPFHAVDIKEERPAGIGYIGNVKFSLGHFPNQPAIYGPQDQIPGFGPFPCTRYMVQNPFYLGSREI